ncbi:helix-turn-helix protein [Kribbella voronezhensis]|uniref:Helix-turn-helix protein n=1 Tax=Kribbella voronezhensis TaxID=2512212 RepID=A0A4R7THF9_9ACTN|nr:helix-turn-helix transcriptional regulator [Kribbella voronezhensis]TDU91720.1 helix-turn-helix protein [Kribbella voronezhensis]
MAEAAFGVQLRQSRQAAALSLRQLATRVGYDHSYLSQVERGQRPGSAHLAQLCDRELNTGTTLTTAYQQAQRAQPVPQPPAAAYQLQPLRHPVEQAMSADLLEAVRHGLVDSYGQARPEEEWNAVVADLAVAFTTTPPGELLPELTAHLQLLPAERSAGRSATHAVLVTELSILVALTLTALGQSRAAGRWWWTSRTSADSSGERLAMSLARGWEASGGVTGSRPLGELLTLADEAVALGIPVDDAAETSDGVVGGRSGCLAQAYAARALVLAQQGSGAAAWKAVEDLLTVTDETAGDHQTSGLFDWPAYKVHGVEGRVCAELGYPAAGYVVLERALELCPPGRLVERAELELRLARCLMVDGEVAAGLALAMRVLVELPDQWHTHYLYDEAGRVLSAVPGKELGRAAVRDYRELLGRRPYLNRSVGSGSSSAWSQG